MDYNWARFFHAIVTVVSRRVEWAGVAKLGDFEWPAYSAVICISNYLDPFFDFTIV